MKRTIPQGFPIIPEGEQTVMITEVDEKDYEYFQKIVIHVEDKNGARARVNLSFVNDDGTPNDMADTIYGFICRAALNDQTIDEVDSQDLVGAFVVVEVEHNQGTKGGTFANIKKWLGQGDPFKRKAPAADKPAQQKPPAKSAQAAPKKTPQQIIEEMKARKAAGK